MKLSLLALLVAVAPLKFALADEASAVSARSTENSPVIPAAEGEGELTLDAESPAAKYKSIKGSENKQLDALCKADSNPEDCKENTRTDLKKMVKKKKPFKAKRVSKPEESAQ